MDASGRGSTVVVVVGAAVVVAGADVVAAGIVVVVVAGAAVVDVVAGAAVVDVVAGAAVVDVVAGAVTGADVVVLDARADSPAVSGAGVPLSASRPESPPQPANTTIAPVTRLATSATPRERRWAAVLPRSVPAILADLRGNADMCHRLAAQRCVSRSCSLRSRAARATASLGVSPNPCCLWPIRLADLSGEERRELAAFCTGGVHFAACSARGQRPRPCTTAGMRRNGAVCKDGGSVTRLSRSPEDQQPCRWTSTA